MDQNGTGKHKANVSQPGQDTWRQDQGIQQHGPVPINKVNQTESPLPTRPHSGRRRQNASHYEHQASEAPRGVRSDSLSSEPKPRARGRARRPDKQVYVPRARRQPTEIVKPDSPHRPHSNYDSPHTPHSNYDSPHTPHSNYDTTRPEQSTSKENGKTYHHPNYTPEAPPSGNKRHKKGRPSADVYVPKGRRSVEQHHSKDEPHLLKEYEKAGKAPSPEDAGRKKTKRPKSAGGNKSPRGYDENRPKQSSVDDLRYDEPQQATPSVHTQLFHESCDSAGNGHTSGDRRTCTDYDLYGNECMNCSDVSANTSTLHEHSETAVPSPSYPASSHQEHRSEVTEDKREDFCAEDTISSQQSYQWNDCDAGDNVSMAETAFPAENIPVSRDEVSLDAEDAHTSVGPVTDKQETNIVLDQDIECVTMPVIVTANPLTTDSPEEIILQDTKQIPVSKSTSISTTVSEVVSPNVSAKAPTQLPAPADMDTSAQAADICISDSSSAASGQLTSQLPAATEPDTVISDKVSASPITRIEEQMEQLPVCSSINIPDIDVKSEAGPDSDIIMKTVQSEFSGTEESQCKSLVKKDDSFELHMKCSEIPRTCEDNSNASKLCNVSVNSHIENGKCSETVSVCDCSKGCSETDGSVENDSDARCQGSVSESAEVTQEGYSSGSPDVGGSRGEGLASTDIGENNSLNITSSSDNMRDESSPDAGCDANLNIHDAHLNIPDGTNPCEVAQTSSLQIASNSNPGEMETDSVSSPAMSQPSVNQTEVPAASGNQTEVPAASVNQTEVPAASGNQTEVPAALTENKDFSDVISDKSVSRATGSQCDRPQIAADDDARPVAMEDEDEDSWDALYTDEGEALDPKLMEELSRAVGKVSVQKPKFDYYSYQPKEPDLDYEAYGHLIEIHDFPNSLLTRDLIGVFKEYLDKGFDIKWVDDTHAIGVFSSTIAAHSALQLQHPFIKVRPISQATKQTKLKAKRCTEFLQPYKPRPETTAAVARNLVTGALGLSSRIPREKRDEERRKLKEAREKRREAAKAKRDAWDGTYKKCAMDEEDDR